MSPGALTDAFAVLVTYTTAGAAGSGTQATRKLANMSLTVMRLIVRAIRRASP
jgi:hypothetical protein